MYQRILTYLANWNANTEDRVKLQHVYAFGAAALLIVAGVISLFNYPLGQFLLPIALVGIAIYFINAIVWALVTAFVFLRLQKLGGRSRTTKR